MGGSYQNLKKSNLITAYLAVAVVIGLVLTLNYKLGSLIEKNSALTPVVNMAGKESILSQNITKNVLILADQPGNTERIAVLDSLNDQFIKLYNQLITHPANSINSQKFDSLYQAISPSYHQLVSLSLGDLHQKEIQEQVLKTEAQFLTIMEEITSQYVLEIDGRWGFIVNNTSTVIYSIIIVMVLVSIVAISLSQKKVDNYSTDLKESEVKLRAAHEEIKSKYNKLDFLTTSIQVGIWERSEVDQSESWSPRLYQMLGYKPNEIEGSYENFMESVHPSDINILKEAANKSMNTGQPSTIEIRVRTKNGSYKWVEATGNIKRDDHHKVSLMMGGIIDINNRKILENQLTVFIENAPAAIAMFDCSMNYLIASNKWGDDYQLDVNQIIGMNHYEIFPEIEGEWKSVHQKCLKGAIVKKDEDLFERANGTVHWIKWEVRPWYISDDEVGGLIMLTQDITESKMHTLELNKAKNEAIKASKAKEQFLATMSHEIRTPLNAINGLTHILLSENPRKDQEESLNLLKFSGDNLLTLINDILDITKIDSGKLKLDNQPFDFHYLVENIKKSLAYKAKENLVNIITQYDSKLPDVFIGDITRITQIVYNLVGNAIKFTQNGHVNINIDYVKHQGKEYTLRVAVIDEGIGISKDHQEKIFNSFEQADSGTTRKYGGTGLGLYISKKLLQMMGSQIQLISEQGKGSTFYFDLKLQESSLEIKERRSDMKWQDFSKRNIHVLVAEDNMANQIVMRKFLTKAGVKHTIVENGALVLDDILSQSYDMIFMDLQMPVLDGYLTTKAIREKEDDYFKEIPIIALTADAFSDIRTKALSAGMTDYLSKPFKPSDLYNILDKYAEALECAV